MAALCVCACACFISLLRYLVRCRVVRATISGEKNQLYTWYSERRPLSLRSELRVGRRILPTWWHLFFFQTPVPWSQLPVSRFRLLDIVENSHRKGTSTTLNAVAKENIHVRAKVLVNLKLIGSCITGSQPKRVFHMRHSVAVFADKLITQIERR